MIKVGVNGYGTIGGRVADAVTKQKDMELVGVTKFTPDYRAKLAIDKGIQIYVPDAEGAAKFAKAKIPTQGTLQELMKKVDVMVEATDEEVASGNKDDVREGRRQGDIRGRRGARADRAFRSTPTATTTAPRGGSSSGS